MPDQAKRHFDEDIARAKALVDHAEALPHGTAEEALLRDDVLRSAWMLAVGAMDAYFCDAYTDLIAKTLRAKSLQPGVTLPRFVKDLKIPIGSVLAPYQARENWRWRMAARQLMERGDVLSLDKVQQLFNPFCRAGDQYRLFSAPSLDAWIGSDAATARLFGTAPAQYQQLTNDEKRKKTEAARKKLFQRFGQIIQRRHDCIHNCDRPKVTVQRVPGPGTINNVIRDIEFLVDQCNHHLDQEFEHFLRTTLGCNAGTMNQLGY